MKRVRLLIIPILLACFLVSCASQTGMVQTEQQQAQVILGAFQDSLGIAFDSGKLYVSAHPEKLQDWKTKIIPLFDAANKILADLETKGKAGTPITVSEVTNTLAAKILEIQTALTGWGVILK